MKKAFLPFLALTLAVFTLTVHVPRSLAELRSSAREAETVALKSARTVTGPRLNPRRVRAMQKPVSVVTETPETPSAPAPFLVPAKSHLERLLEGANLRPRHYELASAVLGTLPKDCQEKLQTFSVLYGNPKHRGLAGHGVVIVSGEVDDQEFIGLLLHEGLGHFQEITCLVGTAASGASAFKDGSAPIWNDDASVAFYSISWQSDKKRKSDARHEDFVTGYAYEGDNFEDLAESVTYYITQEDAFRERAAKNPALAKKLAWLETHMPKTLNVGQGLAWNGQIAWDATKLTFQWTGN